MASKRFDDCEKCRKPTKRRSLNSKGKWVCPPCALASAKADDLNPAQKRRLKAQVDGEKGRSK